MSGDLALWLTQIWDEQEALAKDAAGWDRSGRNRASGQWVRSGISSLEDDERRSVIYSDSGQVSEAVADHVARHDPASVLARIAADRQILAVAQRAWDRSLETARESEGAEWLLGYRWALHEACQHLASVYADRPGYREEWRP